MRNIYFSLVFISFSLIVLTSCRANKDIGYEGVRINNEVYQELNNEDIEEFIEDNNMEPLGVDTIYGYNTVFIFGDLYTSGYYEVYKKDDVVSEGRKVVAMGDWSNSGSVVFSGGTASGDYPFSVVYILDDELIDKGYVIDIIGENSSIKKDIIKKAFVVETNKIGSINRYSVIDSNGEILMQESLNEANESNKILESQVKENNVSNEVAKQYYGDYQGNDDFADIINDNPIDKDYRIEHDKYQENSEATTLGWDAMAVRYTMKWQEEVKATLEYLYESLSEKDSLNLKQSQKSWQSSMDDDFNFVNNAFISTRYLGTQGMVQISTVELHKTRDRAIELMEYIFILDRTAVDFVYDN